MPTEKLTIGGNFSNHLESEKSYLPKIEYPTEQQLFNELNKIQLSYGVYVITRHPEKEIGINELTLYFKNGAYMILALEQYEGYDEIRSTYNPDAPNKNVYFQGENYSAKNVIFDFETVKKIFLEYYHTGRVSDDLLVLSS